MTARLALAIALALAAFAMPAAAQRAAPPAIAEVSTAQLPREARETLAAIRTQGPFAYSKDGAVFGNREGLLPKHKRGYYREYTVRTPGERSRGARRIVVGNGGELYYTDDHYNHFRRIRE